MNLNLFFMVFVLLSILVAIISKFTNGYNDVLETPAEYMWKTDITFHIRANNSSRHSWCRDRNFLSLMVLVHTLKDHSVFREPMIQLLEDTKTVALKYGRAFNGFRSVRGRGIEYTWDFNHRNFTGYRVCPVANEVGRYQAMAHDSYECEAGVFPDTDPVFSFGLSFVERWRIRMENVSKTTFCNKAAWFLGLETDHLNAVKKYIEAILSEKGILDAEVSEHIQPPSQYTTSIGASSQIYAQLCGDNRAVTHPVESNEASCLMEGFAYGGQNAVKMHAQYLYSNVDCIGTACGTWRIGGWTPAAATYLTPMRGNGRLRAQSLNNASKHQLKSPIAVQVAPRGERRTWYYVWEIAYISGSPDGVQVSHILAINGQFPGPTIDATVGDTITILVKNRIQDGQNTTIHWHGIHQRGSPFEDGPSNLVQCPIKAGTDQLYKFKVENAGTYWYHSHVKSQYTEGLWGLLLVHPELEGTRKDGEFSVTINEWYHKPALENEEWFLSKLSHGSPPYPDSILMNGVGRYDCRQQRDKICNETSQLRPVFELPYTDESPVFIMRVLNVGGWAEFSLHVEGHRLQPVEADGLELRGQKAFDHAYLGPGQRYAFQLIRDQNYPRRDRFRIIVHVQRQFLFWRRDVQNINPNPGSLIGHAIGYIHYARAEGVYGHAHCFEEECRNFYCITTADNWCFGTQVDGKVILPTFEQFGYADTEPGFLPTINRIDYLEEGEILTANVESAPRFTREITLNITFQNDANGIRRGSFNYAPSFLPGGEPLLARAINGQPFPNTTQTITVRYGEVVQIVVNNLFEGAHPIHLHGHHFWIVGMGRDGAGVYRAGRDRLEMTHTMRDTVMVRARTWIVIRFRADNPGVWTLHCHIDWHNLSGMMLSFVEAPERLSEMAIPEEAKRVCRAHGINIEDGSGHRRPWSRLEDLTATFSVDSPASEPESEPSTAVCGGVIAGSEGSIEYKQRAPYENGDTCVWILETECANGQIELELVSDGFIQNETYLTILGVGGSSQNVNNRYEPFANLGQLHKGNRKALTVPGPVAIVTFITAGGSSGPVQGFTLNYRGVGDALLIDAVLSSYHLNGPNGSMGDPVAGTTYAANEITTIVVNPKTRPVGGGSLLNVSIDFMLIQPSYNCGLDVLEAHSLITDSVPSMTRYELVGRYCGYVPSVTIINENDGPVVLVFRSDSSVQYNGFRFTYALG